MDRKVVTRQMLSYLSVPSHVVLVFRLVEVLSWDLVDGGGGIKVFCQAVGQEAMVRDGRASLPPAEKRYIPHLGLLWC